MLISKLSVNPVNWSGGLSIDAERRLNEIGVDDACCVIVWEHTRST